MMPTSPALSSWLMLQLLPRVSVLHGSGAALAVPEVGKVVTARVGDRRTVRAPYVVLFA